MQRLCSVLAALSISACSLTQFRPAARERAGIDDRYLRTYTVGFEVACDSCRIEYGKEGETSVERATGGWEGSVYLGAVLDGEPARVMLRAVPLGETRVRLARIMVGGRAVATREDLDVGEMANIRTRVGAE